MIRQWHAWRTKKGWALWSSSEHDAIARGAAHPSEAYSPECVEGKFSEVQLKREEGWLAEVRLPGVSSSHTVATKKHSKARVPAGKATIAPEQKRSTSNGFGGP